MKDDVSIIKNDARNMIKNIILDFKSKDFSSLFVFIRAADRIRIIQ